MHSNKILQSDLLDIIFENRNQQYGAYTLRKYYGNRLNKAIVITFSLFAILSMIILWKKKDNIPSTPVFETIITELGNVKNLPPVQKPPVAPDPPKPIQVKVQPPINSQIFVSHIALVAVGASKLADNLDSVAISNVTTASSPGNSNAHIIGAVPTTSTNTGNNTATPKTKIDKMVPVASAEVMPMFPGGDNALMKFLQKNLYNPQDLEEGQVVSVKVRFVVGFDGVLKSFETIEDGGKTFNNEVIRVLKKMPAWIPGKTAGENISVYYTIPVKFTSGN